MSASVSLKVGLLLASRDGKANGSRAYTLPRFGKISTVQMFRFYGRSLIDVHIVGARRYM
jgi:hypothetical protein